MADLQAKKLTKRFYIAIALVSIIFAITLLSAPVSPENLSKETLVLKEAPVFLKQRNGNSHDYKIQFRFEKLETPLEITGADLEFTDRKALQSELKPGDTVNIKYHHTFICQLSKNGKEYMSPEVAFKSGESTDRLVFWLCLAALLICTGGVLLTKSGLKHMGWISILVLTVVAVVLFFVFGVHFSNTIGYQEF